MTVSSAPTHSGVWAELIGQGSAVATLQRAVAGDDHAMSHAWLITGPPGSGRSNAARAFAAALQCERGGCGECQHCRTALSGAHPDVTLVRTEQLSIGVDEVRDLVRRAAMSPTLGRRQVLVIEDADRITDRGADALLKAIEEPAAKTVWLLCAPTPDDVIVTIRSRCRTLTLTTPRPGDVAELLVRRDGVDPALAAMAARVAQGHVGRARALARNEDARRRRREVLLLPPRLVDLGACLTAAANLLDDADAEVAQVAGAMEERERAEMERALGFTTKGARPRQANAARKDWEDQAKARRTRMRRDALDRVLTELTSYFRDVLTVQLKAGTELINAEQEADIRAIAVRTTPERTVAKLDAILACRTALEGNVAPLLALEALMISLHDERS